MSSTVNVYRLKPTISGTCLAGFNGEGQAKTYQGHLTLLPEGWVAWVEFHNPQTSRTRSIVTGPVSASRALAALNERIASKEAKADYMGSGQVGEVEVQAALDLMREAWSLTAA
jgi:hypothetical protein